MIPGAIWTTALGLAIIALLGTLVGLFRSMLKDRTGNPSLATQRWLFFCSIGTSLTILITMLRTATSDHGLTTVTLSLVALPPTLALLLGGVATYFIRREWRGQHPVPLKSGIGILIMGMATVLGVVANALDAVLQ
ncbi:hypothetical protein [Humidisolicoccus flavus]|uniref:hypothetical protein n=1 Tax=Humidisolicoccus flavus TaxID=3111414 RepID=UPI00324D7F93